MKFQSFVIILSMLCTSTQVLGQEKPNILVVWGDDIGNTNNWLLLKLIGTKSNRDAIGARIKVTVGDLSQIREVDPGNGFSSQSDRRVHFGLGQEEKVDQIEIRWPSGSTKILKDISTNQIITIVEEETKDDG